MIWREGENPKQEKAKKILVRYECKKRRKIQRTNPSYNLIHQKIRTHHANRPSRRRDLVDWPLQFGSLSTNQNSQRILPPVPAKYHFEKIPVMPTEENSRDVIATEENDDRLLTGDIKPSI